MALKRSRTPDFKNLFRVKIENNLPYGLSHGCPTFYGKGQHRLSRTGTRAARGRTTSGIPNRLNYCVISIVYKYTQFTNVAAGLHNTT